MDDDGESVKLTFGTLLASPIAVTVGATNESVITIRDDDPQVSVSFGAATYTVAEGNSVTVRVQLSADPERTVTIPIATTNEGGSSDQDYDDILSSVTFDAGDALKTFRVNGHGRHRGRRRRVGPATFGALPTRASEGTTDESVISITDDDKPTSLTVNFEQSTYTVAEG